ncbi:MAG: 50S ribosome-binding GTPase [Nitrosomonas sp.]|nr:50S ribosome-binding GTPase [Nitrosomonas sp.]
MKKILPYGIDPLRLLAFLLMIVPFMLLLGSGMVWLWQNSFLLFWALAMLVSGGLGYGLQYLLAKRDRKLLAEAATEPNPEWPMSADKAWEQVQALADACKPEDWPLEEGDWILVLGRRTMETVARCYYPDVEKPLYELTVPHTLLVIERASRDLRQDVAENIPFSNRLTIGDFFRIQRWKDKAEQVYDIYRAGRAIVNPVNALLGEAWRQLRERSFMQVRDELHGWFLKTYIRKVGYYAIDLYSGRLVLADDEPVSARTTRTTKTRADMHRMQSESDTFKTEEEPLRIVVLGRSNAGKSSLINALFGKLTSAVDILPDCTDSLKPFAVSREGLTQALIFDSPGCDSERFDRIQMLDAAKDADLILWVTPAIRPDRQIEREYLDALRDFQSTRLNRRPPPILVVVSQIDRLRPASEWNPPYDLTQSHNNAKAANIKAAVEAVANDLTVPADQVIPVSLMEGRTYNVDDTLWAAILSHQEEALRTRLLRCMDEQKKAENWTLLRKQMLNAGRFLKDLPEILGKR